MLVYIYKMVTQRCTGLNLVNHLIQINKITDYEVTYVYEKENYDNEWLCVVTFSTKGKDHSYVQNDRNQKKAYNTILTNILPVLTKIAGIKIYEPPPILQ
jgi:hypothetical protein